MTETMSTFQLALYTRALQLLQEGAFDEADELIKRFGLKEIPDLLKEE